LAEKSKDQFSRDFLGLFDFRLLQQNRWFADVQLRLPSFALPQHRTLDAWIGMMKADMGILA
jgi:hypothetical protein